MLLCLLIIFVMIFVSEQESFDESFMEWHLFEVRQA